MTARQTPLLVVVLVVAFSAALHAATNFTQLLATRHLNLVYIKTYKTASSTTAGIFRNVADRRGLSGARDNRQKFDQSSVFCKHSPLFDEVRLTVDKARHRSFLATSTREPWARCMSHWNMVRQVPDHLFSDLHSFIAHYCDEKVWRHVRPGPDADVNATVGMYNFILVAEQFDESLVVLGHLLGLSHWDLLYIPAKVAGDPLMRSKFEPLPPDGKYKKPPPGFLEKNVHDYMFHHQAKMKLARQIQRIPNFRQQVEQFTKFRESVAAVCAVPGVKEDCLWGDHACGYLCFDRLETKQTGRQAGHYRLKPADVRPAHLR